MNAVSMTSTELLASSHVRLAGLVEAAETLEKQRDWPRLIANRILLCVELENHCNIQLAANYDNIKAQRISYSSFRQDLSDIMERRRTVNEDEMRLMERKGFLLEEFNERSNTFACAIFTQALSSYWIQKKSLENRRAELERWKEYLVKFYVGSQRNSPYEEHWVHYFIHHWCPILHEWVYAQDIRAPCIVPRSKREAYVETLFGVDNAEVFLTSHRNGLFMESGLASAFAKGFFTIVPAADYDENARPEYRVYVLNHNLLSSKGGERYTVSRFSWPHVSLDDIDGKLLKFPTATDIRPSRKCLFHHTVTSLLWAKQQQRRAWDTLLDAEDLRMGKGPYLCRSLLEAMWNEVIGTNLPDRVRRRTFNDPKARHDRVPILQWRAALEESRACTCPGDWDSNNESELSDSDDEYDGSKNGGGTTRATT